MSRLVAFFFAFISCISLHAQLPPTFQWLPDGQSYREVIEGEIVEISLAGQPAKILVSKAMATPEGASVSLPIRSYEVAAGGDKVLLYTNTRRVWRYDTRGDYWVIDLKTGQLRKLGAQLPEASLMFAKFSPDGRKAAFVSGHNIYVEDLQTFQVKALTRDGAPRMINGTFDWAYEEEFDCRDGFRWSPDSKTIAFWQIDATGIRDFLMINNTDSVYSFNVPVEYPKVGEMPSRYKIGVVDIATAGTRWMQIPGDPGNTYLPRMEFAGNAGQLVVQQLNRKQNESILYNVNTATGAALPFYTEKEEAWIDIKSRWENGPEGWDWLSDGNEFVWISEKDGWRHAYRVSRDGRQETLITPGAYDLIEPVRIDESNNAYYFIASPDNATQAYLYRANLDGTGTPQRLSPVAQPGTHAYEISPKGHYAIHTFSNAKTPPVTRWITLPDHTPLTAAPPDRAAEAPEIEFFKVTTADGVEVDAWMVKPEPFDPSKKYPIVFFVYGEPAMSTVRDVYGTGRNRNYRGNMARDGYIYASMDNRGTPSPKGKAWRKAIYRNIGVINIRDQVGAARAILEKFPFIDTSRVAVHGHSGGGSSTLNLLFQYPGVFQTGIAVAAVASQLTYDNIYQERYMGLPQENLEDFLKGSPVTHAKNLQGNLLYIHGTGDDNVHYQNAELLINELVAHNRQFQFMAYPNRTHGIREGEGTVAHFATLFTEFLKKHCPPGGR